MGTAFNDSTDTAYDADGVRTFQSPPIVTAVEDISTAVIARLKKAGGTMTGKIILDGDPSQALHAATKQYVDSVATGASTDPKDSVAFATTAALPACTYNNGASGVGATLTGNSNGALTAQDGVTPTVNARCLIKNQASGLQNGIYTVTTVGDGSNPFVLTRATDADQTGEITQGTTCLVAAGSTLVGTTWFCTTTGTITIGTTATTWVQTSAAASLGTGSVTSTHILDGTIVAGDLASNAVTNAKITDGTIVATSKLSATGTKNSTTFLRGDDTWAAPPSAGTLTTTTETGTSFTIASHVTVASNTGTVTATLPSAGASVGQAFTIYKSGATGIINVTPAGSDTILGQTNPTPFVIAVQHESVTLTPVGTNWFIR